MKHSFILIIRFYKYFISPLLGNRCRFYPTCSDYARECIEHHSIAKSSILITKRLCKCHPFHDGGLDPVPT